MANRSIRAQTYPLLQQGGLSATAIARQLGCAVCTVLRHARELHIIDQERITPRYDWREVQAAYDKGANPTACMERFGFSSSAWTRAIETGKIIPDPARQYKRNVAMNESIVGRRQGKLVVVRRVGKDAQGCRLWLCRCDCGGEKVLTTAGFSHVQSCGCLQHAKGAAHVRWKGCGEIHGAYWTEIQRRATLRHISFDLTIEQAWNLLLKQQCRCALSGVSITARKVKGHQSASLDRIDSTKGYTLDNVQWVHKDVNKMKLDHSTTTFLDWIDAIYHHNHHESTRQTDRSAA